MKVPQRRPNKRSTGMELLGKVMGVKPQPRGKGNVDPARVAYAKQMQPGFKLMIAQKRNSYKPSNKKQVSKGPKKITGL